MLKRGTFIAGGTMEQMHAEFVGLGLEAGFMQITEQVDADGIGQNTVSAIRS